MRAASRGLRSNYDFIRRSKARHAALAVERRPSIAKKFAGFSFCHGLTGGVSTGVSNTKD